MTDTDRFYCDILIHIVPNDVPTATITFRRIRVNVFARVVKKFKNIWRS